MRGASFAERRQASRLLFSLRDAITTPNLRLPGPTCHFVAHGLRVLLRPLHPQYRPLNAYIVGRPYLSLDEVPMLFNALHGGGPRAREERIWLLQLVGRSLQTEEDLDMIRRRHALQLVMSLHDSPIADAPTRRACIALLSAAARIRAGAAALLLDHGISGWLAAVAHRMSATASGGSGANGSGSDGAGAFASSSASHITAVASLAALLLQLLSSEASRRLSAPQATLCARAVDALWRCVAPLPRTAAAAALAASLARCLLALLTRHQQQQQPGKGGVLGQAIWRDVSPACVCGLLAVARAVPASARRGTYISLSASTFQAAGGADCEDDGEDSYGFDRVSEAASKASRADAVNPSERRAVVDDWGLSSLAHLGSWQLTLPTEPTAADAAPVVAAHPSLAHTAIDLLKCIVAEPHCPPQALRLQVDALCGFAIWLRGCSQSFSQLHAVMNQLPRVLEEWSHAIPLDLLSRLLKAGVLSGRVKEALC